MSDPRRGFFVAGYLLPDLNRTTMRSIEVLAKDEDTAKAAVERSYPNFKAEGAISEDDLFSYLERAIDVKRRGEIGYIVAGVIRQSGQEDLAHLMAVSSTSSDGAVLEALDQIPNFIPISTESESQIRASLVAIERLRTSNPI